MPDTSAVDRTSDLGYAAVPGLPAPGHCLVMGVLNVTPDSFSDGGRWLQPEAAVEHGVELAHQGAHLVDVGGESTRPGAARVTPDEELTRVLTVVRQLAAAGVVVSIDTTRASVAHAALDAGARLVNDVSGGRADPSMFAAVAAAGVPYVLMHSRGPSLDMQQRATYDDVVADVGSELSGQLSVAVAAGVAPEQIILDPGLGFAKDAAHNWALLARLGELAALGRPLLVGASRKSFLGALLTASDAMPRGPLGRAPVNSDAVNADPVNADAVNPDAVNPDAVDRDAAGRDDASAAVAALAAAAGAWCVRVHAVPAAVDAVRVAAAVRAAAVAR